MMRAASYVRVSTTIQDPSGQVERLRAFARARGWELNEYTDLGESGAKERRPALGALMREVSARRVDLVMVTKLDRLARSVRQLVSLAGELEALEVGLVVLDQQLDTTPAERALLLPGRSGTILGESTFLQHVWRPLLRDAQLAYCKPTRSGTPSRRGRSRATRSEVSPPENILKVRDWLGLASVEGDRAVRPREFARRDDTQRDAIVFGERTGAAVAKRPLAALTAHLGG